MLERAVLCLWAALVLGGAGMALANYSLPLGAAPYLQPQPFQPYPQAPLAQPPQTRRNPYSSPTYLPPSPNYREDQTYNAGYYNTYSQNTRESSVRTNINNEYYETNNAGATVSTVKDQGGYGYTAPGTGGQQRGPQQPPQPQQGQQPQGQEQDIPDRPGGYTRVQGGQGRAQLHAVLDYDDDYYEDDTETGSSPANGQDESGGHMQAVTPIQGPIFLKNGTVPVVPLYSYPILNNGSFVQIPILWSALSVALGLEVRGQLIRGVPCVKRFHQLFCPTAGNTYPINRIEHFIDENKALMKRMYGDFTVFTEYGLPRRGKRGAPGVPDPLGAGPEVREPWARRARQAGGTTRARPTSAPVTPPFLNPNQGNSSGRIDACESKMEIVTPYWALNSAGKVRAVVNTMHFEQAIHQEVCSKTQTNRCAGDCGCEQKYKWHRLLAYDPDQDCAGIFMDWFLFPSCCVCRCTP